MSASLPGYEALPAKLLGTMFRQKAGSVFLVSPQWKGVIKQSSRISLERHSVIVYQEGRDGDIVLTPAELMLAADNQSTRSSADTNLDGRISLDEVLRIVQFYNAGGITAPRIRPKTDTSPAPAPTEKPSIPTA